MLWKTQLLIFHESVVHYLQRTQDIYSVNVSDPDVSKTLILYKCVYQQQNMNGIEFRTVTIHSCQRQGQIIEKIK